MESIIQSKNEKKCFICGSENWLESHHIFGGANRCLSEKYGLKVWLCHYCHNEPPQGVHHNRKNAENLYKLGQTAFNLYYPDKDFVSIFGRNFI